jgi:hypothetical protein
MKWEKSKSKNSESDDSFSSLGTKYWQNFCRRNAAIITAKKQFNLLANEMISVSWEILRMCMMMCMKDGAKQALQKNRTT